MTDVDRAFRPHGWGPAVAVTLTIVALTVGGRVVAAAVQDTAGAPVGIPSVATVHPPRGWTVDADDRRPDDDTSRSVLTKGSAVVVVTAFADAGVDLPTLMAVYEDGVLAPRLLHLATTDVTSFAVGGLPGLRLVYVGRSAARAPVEGVVLATVGPSGAGLVIEATAPESVLASVAADIAAMAAGARVA